MKNNQNDIVSGDRSTNVQGRDHVTVNQYNGVTYQDVKEISMDVFKSNFYDLGEKVEQIITERAEKIINRYLEQLQSTSPETIVNTEDPDLRYVIYEAQKSYVRVGDDELLEILVQLLVKRTVQNNEMFSKIVLNEAIKIIPTLTNRQIDIITLIYIVRYLLFNIPMSFEGYLQIINPLVDVIDLETFPRNMMVYQHLQYSGCIAIDIGTANFETVMKHKFPHLNNDELISKIHGNPMMLAIQKLWDVTKLCNSELTSVGIAIAFSDIKRRAGYNWDLGIWINEK